MTKKEKFKKSKKRLALDSQALSFCRASILKHVFLKEKRGKKLRAKFIKNLREGSIF